MFPSPNYHEKIGPGVQWALRHLPFYGRWYRFLFPVEIVGRDVSPSTEASPWRLVDYWSWTREPDLAEFELS